jgi:hypothetical protein
MSIVPAIYIEEAPKLVEHWLVESDAQDYLLKDCLGLSGCQEDCGVYFRERDRCLRIELVVEDGVL